MNSLLVFLSIFGAAFAFPYNYAQFPFNYYGYGFNNFASNGGYEGNEGFPAFNVKDAQNYYSGPYAQNYYSGPYAQNYYSGPYAQNSAFYAPYARFNYAQGGAPGYYPFAKYFNNKFYPSYYGGFNNGAFKNYAAGGFADYQNPNYFTKTGYHPYNYPSSYAGTPFGYAYYPGQFNTVLPQESVASTKTTGVQPAGFTGVQPVGTTGVPFVEQPFVVAGVQSGFGTV